MKLIACLAMTCLLAACGRGPEKLHHSSSDIEVVRSPQSADAAETIIHSTLDPNITLNEDGSLSLPNLFNPQWQGRGLLGNQKLSLIAVE